MTQVLAIITLSLIFILVIRLNLYNPGMHAMDNVIVFQNIKTIQVKFESQDIYLIIMY